MKILVIEDKEIHQQAAKEQLKDHEVVIVSDPEEAALLFKRRHERKYDDQKKREVFVGWLPPKVVAGSFEVVLTDLWMPAPPRHELGGRSYLRAFGVTVSEDLEYVATFMPVGLVFAIAAKNLGLRAGVVSDSSHHSDRLSALLDIIGADPNYDLQGEGQPRPGISRFDCMIVGDPMVKDWKKVLDYLLLQQS